MIKPFAKVFDTPHGQLLAYIGTSETADEDCIRVVGAFVRGAQPSAILSGYPDSEAVEAAFDKIDQSQAEITAAALHNAVAKVAS